MGTVLVEQISIPGRNVLISTERNIGSCCLLQSYEGRKHLLNVGILPHLYLLSQLRRPHLESRIS
jgi:hypothetical protein